MQLDKGAQVIAIDPRFVADHHDRDTLIPDQLVDLRTANVQDNRDAF